MGEIIEIPKKENKEPEMTPEELKLLIEKNEQLKLCLRIMNDLSLNEKDEDYVKDEDLDFIELWNQVSLQKKIDPGEFSPQGTGLYYSIISTGYDNFGAMFFKHMAEEPNAPYFYHAIKCFIIQMENYSKYIKQLEKKIRDLELIIKKLKEKN